MALKDFEAFAQSVWHAPVEDKLNQVLTMIDNTVSSVVKKQSLTQTAKKLTPRRLDQFAANIMLYNGDPVIA